MGNRRGMGAVLSINTFANYDENVKPQIIPTPDPTYQGNFIKVAVNSGLEVLSINGFSKISNPVLIKPFQLFSDSGTLYLYILGETPSTLQASVQLTSRIINRENIIYEVTVQAESDIDGVNVGGASFVESSDNILVSGEFLQEDSLLAIASTNPITINRNIAPTTEENWIYSVEVQTGLTVSRIKSLGLEFLPSPSNTRPNPGEFRQIGNQLIICGSPQFHLDFGQEIQVNGNIEIATNTATSLKIATFHLQTVFYLEKIEWLGISFTPAQDSFNPQVNEFLWDRNGYATVFY